ncbi:type I restriction enzyme, S subunit [Colwellia chukchiensis]|uniref:Type I restriction enzyme, S subunit n=1 Tax=Colwellia chukchiensis TaxID=641665 RepID=A0A1H7IZ96_9GAMM|nr:restriction endonuclease subunit S [Colwellia chukchiensis]SEK67292.1 type I restriction enzyme, S subunit [Colwellia chukchiensis]
MGSKWKKTSLQDLGVKLIDCDHKTPKAVEEGVPYIGIPQMDNGRINFDANPRLISEEDFIKWTRKANPQYGDVILSRRCNSGETVYVPKNSKFALGQNLVLLRPEGDRLHPEYFRWAVHGREWWSEVAKYLNPGAIFESLKCADIPKFEIPEPPKDVQIKIAKVLTNISDKIELNQKLNQTLEQMAQALFKSWFVDFDPVIDNALAAGSDIPEALQHKAEQRRQAQKLPDFKPLPDNIRALFPSEFEQTDEPIIGIAGWIPEGWKPTSIHDMVDTISDTYKLKEVDEVIFLNTGDIEDGKFLHKDYSPTVGLPGQAKKSIAKGDILYSEIRPKNKRYAFVDFDAKEYVVSTKLMVLRAKENINPLLPYFILTQDKTVNELQHVAEHRSGTFPQITFKELAKVLAVFPQGPELIDLFVEQYLTPLFTKKLASIEQNEQLEKLRDTLLPKLISGEVPLKSE